MTHKEIEHFAHKFDVLKSTIDKDWVLGHLLNVMYSLDSVKNNFIFKGGTCLRKCYFENYRFSEDLDFTLLNKNFPVDSNFFNELLKLTEKKGGVKFHLLTIKPQIHNDIQQGYEVKIKFWGADHHPNKKILPVSRWQTYIKIDISYSEVVIEKPVLKKIFHPYPDSGIINSMVSTYSIDEILSEKLRALIQRNRPRDIFDIWNIVKIKGYHDFTRVKRLLLEKAVSKNIKISDVDQFVNDDKYRKNLRAWENSLTKHMPANKLPKFDNVYPELKTIIEKILLS